MSKNAKVLLVATIKNEGPNILEWVAHHLCIGFTHIQVFQNDSDDGTQKHLRTLHKMGVIEYFKNETKNRDWQNKAYRRASRTETYLNVDWCMALDGDEFLNVKTGDGTVQSLISACGDADEIIVNWRYYGSNHLENLSDELVTARYTASENDDAIGDTLRGHKALFRTNVFKRPGIHRAKVPSKADFTVRNGSGRKLDPQTITKWRTRDPELRKLAQVNHYALRDASSFLLKSARGSSSHPDRNVELRYWRLNNFNEVPDFTLSQHQDRTWQKMNELNELSKGRLFFLRENSLGLWREKLAELKQNPHYLQLFNDLISES